jgi:ribosomal protein S18 acetylase RimI-like enzyme
LHDESEIQAIRDLLQRLPEVLGVVDFEEKIQMASIRATTRLWKDGERVAAFAYVDDYSNLWFELDPQDAGQGLEAEIFAWGVSVIQGQLGPGETGSLDVTCNAQAPARVALLERYGFVRQDIRSLSYARSLSDPIPVAVFPDGFSLRRAAGEQEVERLVALHRSAFGTDYMTIDERLAIMRSPQYDPELDLLAEAPDGELAAFCICGFEDASRECGYTDPIGVHERFQRRGLGKAILSAGLQALKSRGARTAILGTSSENAAMQGLAEASGFSLVSEKLWFSKQVG